MTRFPFARLTFLLLLYIWPYVLPAKPAEKTPGMAPASAKKTPPVPANALKIGWAIRDVSSDLPVSIPGNFDIRISKGMYDALYVTALTIDNGTDLVTWLSCDNLHLVTFHVNMLKKKIRELCPEYPIDKLIVNSTHTHTGASLMGAGRHGIPKGIDFDEKGEYSRMFYRSAAEAVIQSWKSRDYGKVAWGFGYVAAGFSRRTIYAEDLSKQPGFRGQSSGVFVGHGTMHGPNTTNFSHYEAGMDPIANFLFTYTKEGKLTGAIINLSTTAQFGNPTPYKMSADFWHETRQLFRKKFGKIYILPQCAAAGDITPRQQHYERALNRRLRLKFGDASPERSIRYRMDIAERIMTAFLEVSKWAGKDKRAALPLRHTIIRPQLKRDVPPPELIAEAQVALEILQKEGETKSKTNESLKERSARSTRINKYKRILSLTEDVAKKPTFEAEIHLVRLGDIAFASNPFELFIDYMHRIQRQSPFEQTFIIQLAMMSGQAAGYLPTERAVKNLGYSAEPCSHTISPEGGATLVTETVKGLRMLLKARPTPRPAPGGIGP